MTDEIDKLRSELLAECVFMQKSAVYDKRGGYSYWPWMNGLYCGTCTNGARHLAQKFDGKVVGYLFEERDPMRFIARDAGGHDFALIGEYLVDWWAWDYELSITSPVLHLQRDARLIGRHYKPKSFWKPVKMERPRNLQFRGRRTLTRLLTQP